MSNWMHRDPADYRRRFLKLLHSEFICSANEAQQVADAATMMFEEIGDPRPPESWIDLIRKSSNDELKHKWNWAVGYALSTTSLNVERYQL